MAKKRPPLDGIFQPQTMALLRTYAQYTKEIDGLDMSLVELAETLVLAHLEEQDRVGPVRNGLPRPQPHDAGPTHRVHVA